jgi:hypothetical protein
MLAYGVDLRKLPISAVQTPHAQLQDMGIIDCSAHHPLQLAPFRRKWGWLAGPAWALVLLQCCFVSAALNV